MLSLHHSNFRVKLFITTKYIFNLSLQGGKCLSSQVKNYVSMNTIKTRRDIAIL